MKPLQTFSLINTTELDEARELVARQFCQHRLEITAEQESFRTLHHVARGQLLSLNYIQYGAAVTIEPGELESFYLVQIPLRGHANIRNGNWTVDSNCTTAAILNPDRHTRMHWSADCEQVLVYIARDVLHSVVANYLGRSVTVEIVFNPILDLTRDCFARWLDGVLCLVEAADAGRLFVSEAAMEVNGRHVKEQASSQALLEEQLIMGLVKNQPSNLSALLDVPTSAALPGTVKTARDYIYAHADQSLTVAEISRVANVPVRTLQHQFRAAGLGSPLKLLLNERLARVYAELESGHAFDTVSEIANRWGFTHFGRFSQYYRRRFHESPSETRRRSLKNRQV